MQPGTKIRSLREERNLSIQDLASNANLDVQQLQLIENEEVAPSLGVLIKISRALGVRLGTFLDDQVKSGAVISRKGDEEKSVSLSSREASQHEKLAFFSLARQKADRHMEPFMVELSRASLLILMPLLMKVRSLCTFLMDPSGLNTVRKNIFLMPEILYI